MISRTVKKDNGWSSTFRKLNDGTITIKQQNKKDNIFREIHIFGKEVLAAFYEVVKQEPKR